jgi:hypothetical protein
VSCEKEKCVCCKAKAAFMEPSMGPINISMTTAGENPAELSLGNPVLDMSLVTIFLAGSLGAEDFVLCPDHTNTLRLVRAINKR